MKISRNPRNYISTSSYKPFSGVSCSQILLTFFYLAVLAGAIYCLFFSSFFEIDKIEISGTSLIEKTEFLSKVQSYKKKNLLLLNTSQIKLKLVKDYPEIDTLVISKELPSILKVKVYEREPTLVWRYMDSDYLLDQDGYVIRKDKPDSFKDYLVIQDQRNKAISNEKQVISKKFIDFSKTINSELKKKKLIAKNNFLTGNSEFELVVQTENFKILFNIIRDPSEQVKALEKIYSKISKEAKEYIDLRVPGKVFYK